MQTSGLICTHCHDASDIITPYNGSTLLASISQGAIIVALHKRCEGVWADNTNCRTLVPLRNMHRWNTGISPSAVRQQRSVRV
jgi:hypothetical protein